jgi:hypothetical protein
MRIENCCSCGKEIEVDEELDDTLEVQEEVKEAANEESIGNEVFLCTECNEKLRKEAEKSRAKK